MSALVERVPERLATVAGEVEAAGARALPLHVDLRSPASAADVVRSAMESAGRLDVLVSNHAVLVPPTPFLETNDADWALELDVNLTSHYALAREAARAMRDAGNGGAIAFTASVNALGAGRGAAAYSATKAGAREPRARDGGRSWRPTASASTVSAPARPTRSARST